ncbi:MAG: MG2 domain-containing protein [Gemmatales bacterium]|nr:MG2 domain-containing protein [Gemmatales bacterium]MDW7993484.1 MG2 domain-containing protein [Gemmatales bacterium]
MSSGSNRTVLAARIGTVLALLGLVMAGGLWLMRSSPVHAGILVNDSAVAYQTADKLLIAVTLEHPQSGKDGAPLSGTLKVSLVDKAGQIVATRQSAINQKEFAESYRFEFEKPQAPPHELQLRIEFGKEQLEVPLAKVLLVKAHETAVLASRDWHQGSRAAIRLQVQGVKSLTETVPVAAEYCVCLVNQDGKKIPLEKGRTDAKGAATLAVQVPDLPPGQYKVEIHTRSQLGEEKLEQTVNIKSDAKILLVSDKPLYQPGQVIHLRALVLRPFDLKPVADSEILFEIQDPKGNKVFKRTVKTSEYGIASVDFQLADEVNLGDYQIRAALGQHESKKTVSVKKYVLPKFKVELTADKKFYLPKETVKAELQCDYFFGKPVAGATVKVSASTFDVEFKEFARWEGKTDANGHAKFEIKLPDYFVGQPLQKGDALVKFDVTVTDTADHSETITRTYPVSDQGIRVGLIPEGGRLVPELENRIFVATVYPDGSPAGECTVRVWLGQEKKGQPVAILKTNAAGLAEFTFVPQKEHLRQAFTGPRFDGDFLPPEVRPIRPGRGIGAPQPNAIEEQTIELLGGRIVPVHGPRMVCDLIAEAQDKQGSKAEAKAVVSCEPLGENVLLRLDKAIYRAGDSMLVDIRSSAGLPTVYLDIIKSGQLLLSQWLDVKAGQATHKLDIPPTLFGSLEVHAYQMLADGQIIRDSRVIYIQPREELKIHVEKEKDVFRPGEVTSIRFQVTDAQGRPVPSALGVIIVDEAVYALQEMQPGLEKIYFTLQEELLKPKVQIVRPGVPLDAIVRQPIDVMPADKQQIAQALLAPIRPKPPQRWEVNPAIERRDRLMEQVWQLGQILWNYAYSNPDCFVVDADGKVQFPAGTLKRAVQRFFGRIDKETLQKLLTGPFGEPITESNLSSVLHPGLTAENLASAFTQNQMLRLYWALINFSHTRREQLFKGGRWHFPENFLVEAVTAQQIGIEPGGQVRKPNAEQQQQIERQLKDAWGRPIRLVRVEKKQRVEGKYDDPVVLIFAEHALVSAGPDGKFGTADDIVLNSPEVASRAELWWLDAKERNAWLAMQQPGREWLFRRNMKDAARGGPELLLRADRGVALPQAAPGLAVPRAGAAAADAAHSPGVGGGPVAEGAAQPQIYVREYFPETLLWQPQLITDDKGVAHLPLQLADSITTWRLTASASSKGGLLGGTTAPIRVFQDFFVDLDLPRTLTQNDEIAFPVAIYNYLKEPQTVVLSLKPEDWFELTDGLGYERKIDLKPNEVTSVKFRIRAKKVGDLPLTVTARGTHMSDAMKRLIEVLPDGEKIEHAVTDRLVGEAIHQMEIPEGIVPDSAKILVKIYPGVMSQVLEGVEGLLRMPFG